MATVDYPHIAANADGAPIVEGTRIKVVMIAREHLDGRDADAIQRLHPGLTLGQIHSALAYYFDHQPAMNEEIARRDLMAERLGAGADDSPVRRKLRGRGLIP